MRGTKAPPPAMTRSREVRNVLDVLPGFSTTGSWAGEIEKITANPVSLTFTLLRSAAWNSVRETIVPGIVHLRVPLWLGAYRVRAKRRNADTWWMASAGGAQWPIS